MRNRQSAIIAGIVALCGIVLVILGIGGLRELMMVGKVPQESLGRYVGFTTMSLFIGLVMIVWYLVAGRAWARGVRAGTAGGETPSPGAG